jgi:EAL domain-containing protein (putative c-di-GMP-specific phosphodiesterase class I)
LLRNILIDALTKKRFEPYFQPIFDLETNACVGFESVLRFPGAIGVPIHDALALAAASPMLGQIGFGMFERVCEIVRLRRREIGERFISVNLSAAQLIQDDIAFRMNQMVGRSTLSPHQFLLEIDDDHLDPTSEPVYGNLRNLREDGFRLALDGLENGNSSLRSLYCGHFEMVKMRSLKSMSAGKPENGVESARRSIFSTVRSLAASANVSVCGKNIETAQDLELAKSAGFRYGQGFYWAKPQPIEEILAWLSSCEMEKTEV